MSPKPNLNPAQLSQAIGNPLAPASGHSYRGAVLTQTGPRRLVSVLLGLGVKREVIMFRTLFNIQLVRLFASTQPQM